MFEGLIQPMYLLILFFVGVFLLCRWLWRKW